MDKWFTVVNVQTQQFLSSFRSKTDDIPNSGTNSLNNPAPPKVLITQPKNKDHPQSSKRRKQEDFGPCERFFLLVFCGHSLNDDDDEHEHPANNKSKQKIAKRRDTIFTGLRKMWFKLFVSKPAILFDWTKIMYGFEPRLTKKNKKAARTIFRLLEKMNCTRDLATKTFSALFRTYPSTVAYMVTTISEAEKQPNVSAMVVTSKNLNTAQKTIHLGDLAKIKEKIEHPPVKKGKPKKPVIMKRVESKQCGTPIDPVREDFGSTTEPAFDSCMFNQKEVAYFTPMTLRHSFLSDQDLVQFAPLISHLGAVTASLVYVVNVMHDLPEVFMFLDELCRIHSKIPGMDASYFRHTMECVDEALLSLIGSDIYKGEWRRSMVQVLEWVFYYSTRDMPDEFNV